MGKFKKELPELSKRLIALMDSERGLQTRLAKSVDKPPSSFSNIKRGKPVNADHLRAVGIVCGSDRLLQILSIENIDAPDIQTNSIVNSEHIDPTLLEQVIEGVESHLSEARKILSPDLKAQLITLLYDYFLKTEEKVHQKKIVSYLKLVS